MSRVTIIHNWKFILYLSSYTENLSSYTECSKATRRRTTITKDRYLESQHGKVPWSSLTRVPTGWFGKFQPCTLDGRVHSSLVRIVWILDMVWVYEHWATTSGCREPHVAVWTMFLFRKIQNSYSNELMLLWEFCKCSIL